ncbi:MAG: phosphoenolpyruvate carboxykinase [Acholeplasmataceae bacterium]
MNQLKKFHLTETQAIINFDAYTCSSQLEILTSKPFEMVLTQYIKRLRKTKNPIMLHFKGLRTQQFLEAYKLLMVDTYDVCLRKYPHLGQLFKHRDDFYRLTEKFYDYWRKIERFGVIGQPRAYAYNTPTDSLINTSDTFNGKILKLYRTITQQILGHDFLVLRQLPAGVNINMVLVPHRFSYHEDYSQLQGVGFISALLSRPPFMVYSNSNTRSGLFRPIDHNPLKDLSINKLHYFCFPIYVGPLLAFVYVHRDFLHQGVGLSNLFEPVGYNTFKDQKPDLVYVYGIREDAYDGTYYHDQDEDIFVGFVSRLEKNDYFGYLKKMLLTLHNVYMIKKAKLPIHGAMVKILLKNGNEKNVVVIGDSGAGKSETLEALRVIGSDYITEMRVIYDDMGTFMIHNDKIVSIGTEIGAFIRLDDLDAGYAYQEMDRAIFLNPDQINARVILPITEFNFMMSQHEVDYLFYANNYVETTEGLKFFDDVSEALDVFRRGARFAKGTTSEVGLVESYFANPFGCVQMHDETDVLLVEHLEMLFDQNIPVGELYTQLAVKGKHMNGPQLAAKKLLKHLLK